MIISTDEYNDNGNDDDNYDDNDDDSDDDNEVDDDDQICNKSGNFQARSSRFSMVIDLDNTQRMIPTMMIMMMVVMMMMMIMMNMMMKIKMIKTQLIFELGTPNFVLQQIQGIPRDDKNNYVKDDID